jgi:hypothetical protein
VINDARQFIALTNTREETETSEIQIGFLAINKNSVEWVRLVEKESVPQEDGQFSRSFD